MQAPSISVFLVDDHPILLSGLEALVKRHPRLTLVGSANRLEDALPKIQSLRPRVVVLDLYLGEKETLDSIPEIHREGVTDVLSLSMSTDLAKVDRALQLGARGFVGKHEPPMRVIDGILAVAERKIFLQEGVADELLRRRSFRGPDAGSQALTPREREIFEKIGEGLQPSEIAQKLGVSTKTVETHKENLKRKFGGISASELRQKAVQERRSSGA
jgi:two-component system nitrate/nitrite response regulator NarL